MHNPTRVGRGGTWTFNVMYSHVAHSAYQHVCDSGVSLIRRRFQPSPALGRPVRVELGQVEQRWVRLEGVFALRLKVGVDLVAVRAREELDGGPLGVARRPISKVESRYDG